VQEEGGDHDRNDQRVDVQEHRGQERHPTSPNIRRWINDFFALVVVSM